MNGSNAHPLYRFLKDRQPGSGGPVQLGEKGRIEWNYVKFLVSANGQPLRRYGSQVDPLDFEDDVRPPLLTSYLLLHPPSLHCPNVMYCFAHASLISCVTAGAS